MEKQVGLHLLIFFILAQITMVSAEDWCPMTCSCKGTVKYSFIDCSSRGIKAIPDNLPANIFKLNLANNPGLKVSFRAFQAHSINTLDLTGNGLNASFALPHGIASLTLDRNNFTEQHIAEMLTVPVRSLLTLNLNENDIFIDMETQVFDNASGLIILSLAKNNVSIIGGKLLKSLHNLHTLILRQSNVNTIMEDAFLNNPFILKLDCSKNLLTTLPIKLFAHNPRLTELRFESNKLTVFPDLPKDAILTILDLSNNQLKDLNNLKQVKALAVSLAKNKFTEIPKLESLSFYHTLTVDLSENLITKVGPHAFGKNSSLKLLNLASNQISVLDRSAFTGLPTAHSVFLSGNRIKHMPSDLFRETHNLKFLLLDRNFLPRIPDALMYLTSKLEVIALFGNSLSQIEDNFGQSISIDTRILIDCDLLVSISILKGILDCSTSQTIQLNGLEAGLARSFIRMGFECSSQGLLSLISCQSCATGFFNNGQSNCQACPRGGYYQDKPAQQSCKLCNPGEFVNRTGGKSPLDCETCPVGADPNKHANTRACYCLPGFARFNRFGRCFFCAEKGVICLNDHKEVAPGYWWQWFDKSLEQNYICFCKNLLTHGLDYDNECLSFYHSLPRVYKCPFKGACLGGIQSKCQENYTGPLCAVCAPSYYSTQLGCVRCPTLLVSVLKLCMMPLLLLLLFMIIRLAEKVPMDDNKERDLADVILSTTKVFLAHWQIMAVIIRLLSSIAWPKILITITFSLYLITLEVFSFPVMKCIHPALEITAYHEMMITVGALIMLPILMIFLCYLHPYIIGACSHRNRLIQPAKKYYLKYTVLIIFIAYPFLCQRIFQVLPIACRKLCYDTDRNNCVSYLAVDYRDKCVISDSSKVIYLRVAYAACVFPLIIPFALFLVLWYSQKKRKEFGKEAEEVNALCFATRFCSENYKASFWYWEIIDLLRKLLFTVGFAFFGLQARTTLGAMIVITGIFTIMYAYCKPILSASEHFLHLLSTASLFLTLCMGVVLSAGPEAEKHTHHIGDRLPITCMLLVVNGGMFLLFLVLLIKCVFYICKRKCQVLSSPITFVL